MGKTKYKTCPVCGESFPANRDFFKRHSDQTLHDKCRHCEDKEKMEFEWRGDLLKCHICGEYLPVTEFGYSGHYPYRDNHDSRCRKCRVKQTTECKKKYSGDYALSKILQMRFLSARDRANKKGIPFNLTKEYLKELWDKQEGKCAISGIEMTFDQCKGRTATNVSIDQINPNEGYVVGNVQLVCMAMNQFKSDFGMDEVYMFCEAILKNRDRIRGL